MRRPASDPPASRVPGFEIRRMVAEDLEAVMQIERQAFKHPWSTELFRRELDHDWSTILLAEERTPPREGGHHRPAAPPKLLGFIIYWVVHDEIHVLNLATQPAERRRGVARTLLAETLKRGAEGGAALATLEVRRSNAAALALYEQLGFRAVGVRPNYYVDEGEDAIVMVKYL